MSWLLEFKWLIIISCEIFAWLATIYMFYARYWLDSQIKFIVSGILAIITGYVPHITLAILDYFKAKEIHTFTLFIILLLLFGFTLGKKYVIKLDETIKRLSTKYRNENDN